MRDALPTPTTSTAAARRPRTCARASERPLDQVDQIWRLLRQPFPLPVAAVGHACDWEVFDGSGRAGCRLCSAIHVCAPGACSDTSETEDAVVCNITGVEEGRV